MRGSIARSRVSEWRDMALDDGGIHDDYEYKLHNCPADGQGSDRAAATSSYPVIPDEDPEKREKSVERVRDQKPVSVCDVPSTCMMQSSSTRAQTGQTGLHAHQMLALSHPWAHNACESKHPQAFPENLFSGIPSIPSITPKTRPFRCRLRSTVGSHLSRSWNNCLRTYSGMVGWLWLVQLATYTCLSFLINIHQVVL